MDNEKGKKKKTKEREEKKRIQMEAQLIAHPPREK